MQVVLCAVLGISVLIAWLVQRQRTAALLPPLGETRRAGALYVRLPRGWVLKTGKGGVVEAQESRANSTITRLIILRQVTLEDDRTLPDAADFAAERLTRGSPEDFEKFDFLGRPGVLVDVPAQVESDGFQVHVRPARLEAFAVLPSHLAVELVMTTSGETGLQDFDAADIELFKNVAASLHEAGGVDGSVAAAGQPRSRTANALRAREAI